MTGFRDISIGYDSRTYIEEYISEGSISQNLEIGFKLYNYLCRSFKLAPIIYQFINSLIINLLIFVFFIKISDYYPILFALYLSSNIYFIMHLNLVREAISIGLALNAINCLFDKKLPLFLILSAAAISFHTSALFILASCLIGNYIIRDDIINYNIGRKYIFLIILLIALKSYLYEIINCIALSIGAGRFRFIAYIIDSSKIGGLGFFKPWHIAGLFMLTYYIAINHSYYSCIIKAGKLNFMIKIYYSGYILFILSSINMLVGDRLFYYFYFIGYWLIVNLIQFIKEKDIFILLLLAFTLLWYYKTIMLQYPNWFIPPYPNMTAPLR
jgi:hypothetical protein